MEILFLLILLGVLIIVILVCSLCSKNFRGEFLLVFSSVTFGVALSCYLVKDTPKAIDVYRGNTALKITSINGVPKDTVVIFKDE